MRMAHAYQDLRMAKKAFLACNVGRRAAVCKVSPWFALSYGRESVEGYMI